MFIITLLIQASDLCIDEESSLNQHDNGGAVISDCDNTAVYNATLSQVCLNTNSICNAELTTCDNSSNTKDLTVNSQLVTELDPNPDNTHNDGDLHNAMHFQIGTQTLELLFIPNPVNLRSIGTQTLKEVQTKFVEAVDLPADDIVEIFKAATTNDKSQQIDKEYATRELGRNKKILICNRSRQTISEYVDDIMQNTQLANPEIEWILTERCSSRLAWNNKTDDIALEITSKLVKEKKTDNRLKIVTFFGSKINHKKYNNLDNLIGCKNILRFQCNVTSNNDHGPGIPIYLLWNERCFIDEKTIRICVADYKTRMASVEDHEINDIGKVSGFNAYRGYTKWLLS